MTPEMLESLAEYVRELNGVVSYFQFWNFKLDSQVSNPDYADKIYVKIFHGDNMATILSRYIGNEKWEIVLSEKRSY